MTTIRPAVAADMAAVADLWHEGWHSGHAGRPHRWQRTYETRSG